MTPAVSASNLQKSFGTLTAVSDLSFSIEPGETFGLLGPNGAGKTTTIRMITGSLRPDSGTVAIAGEADPTRAAVRRRLGLAPQSLSLYEELTARENLDFFASLYGLSGAARTARVDFALEFAGLTDRAGDRAGTYSGGMKRRLNLAAALVHDPEVILLDEPTVGVDPQSRHHIFERIGQLQASGKTILYTTHYMEEAQRLCNRVAIVDQGRLLDVDTPAALIARHGGVAHVTIEFNHPPSSAEGLPGTLEGTTLTFQSERPIEQIAALTSKLKDVATIGVREPDLESVFLNLTGRTLRD